MEEDFDIDNTNKSYEEEFQQIGAGRYKMVVTNPWEMENPWR